jgi:arginase family enzyme
MADMGIQPCAAHQIRILGVPMDLGQQRRGVDMGPSALRYAGLFKKLERLGCQVEDAGNVLVPGRDSQPFKVIVGPKPRAVDCATCRK